MEPSSQNTQGDYKKDAQGRLVPIATIRPIDLARDALVTEIIGKAREQSAALAKFKTTRKG